MRRHLFPSVVDDIVPIKQVVDEWQFALLVLVNFFVGGMVGIERSILPLVAITDFGIGSVTAATAFIATFGLAKSVVNFIAGGFSDRWGRRPFLVGGWLIGLPVPVILLTAGSWAWILFANVLLGIQQGLTWSMTLNMKFDRVEPGRHGWAAGWNECAGYSGVALAAFLSGLVASWVGSRPALFLLGLILAVSGTVLSFYVRETHRRPPGRLTMRSVSRPAVLTDTLAGPGSLVITSTSGLLMNLKDGMLWGLLPIIADGKGLDLGAIGVVAGVYPGVWGIAQLLFGTLSDRVDRRVFIAVGLFAQAGGLLGLMFAATLLEFILSGVIIGIGTAMAYPTLLALVTSVSPVDRRASALGVYRFWRDMGYVGGAIGVGVVVDAAGYFYAFIVVAFLLATAAVAVGVVRVQITQSSKEETSCHTTVR